MTPKPLVSVLMTSYNYAAYVNQAVESVLSQTFKDFELIVVDDGSSDSSPEILQKFNDDRMKVVVQENQGQAAALNRAFRESCGELIALIDSDDWWAPEKLAALVERHKALKGQYSVLQHNLTIVKGETRQLYKPELPSGNCFEEMLRTDNINFFVPTSGLAFSRTVLEKIIPIPAVFRVSPDAYIMRTAMVFGPVVSISDPLGFLRIHGSNAGMGAGEKMHRKLRREILYPELNKFYASRGIDYRFGEKNEKSFDSSGALQKKICSLSKRLKNWIEHIRG